MNRDSEQRRIVLARHLESEKNVRDIHGFSEYITITNTGRTQAARLAQQFTNGRRGVVNGILSTPTPQAAESAKLLSGLTGLPYEGDLSLDAVHLGVASGKSNEELRLAYPDAFRMLDLFRARVISASELSLPGGESAAEIESRLLSWWRREGEVRCPNKLIIGSNSTVLMLAHFLNGILPTDPRYKFIATPNGTWSVWLETAKGWVAASQIHKTSWPDVEMMNLPCAFGSVAVTRHAASWVVKDTALVVIPGYFGSSRHGPYGLYSRLASAWSYEGYLSITLDPLGLGDSSPIFRTFDSDVDSVVTVIGDLQRTAGTIVIVGHSMGVATGLAVRERLGARNCKVWGLAPLCRLSDMSHAFFSAAQQEDLIRNGRTFRHGLELRREMIDNYEAVWNRFYSTLDAVWVASTDPYAATVDLGMIDPAYIRYIDGADHNFSNDYGVYDLQRSTLHVLDLMDGSD